MNHAPDIIFTIGHSTRSVEEFTALLVNNSITLLADVRKMPASRRHPHFSKESLVLSLHAVHIKYRHFPGLGGMRKPEPDSVNTAWHNQSFQGYADYMQSPEFQHDLQTLIELSEEERIAIMCAESVPWRCHRSLIADALIARELTVMDIIDERPPTLHRLNPIARLEGMRVTYPESQHRLI